MTRALNVKLTDRTSKIFKAKIKQKVCRSLGERHYFVHFLDIVSLNKTNIPNTLSVSSLVLA